LTSAKRQLWGDLLRDDPRQAIESSKKLIDKMMQEPDYAEGVAALKGRRPPNFAR
jgi:enoyl-CoA hydratase/carnithine racemase